MKETSSRAFRAVAWVGKAALFCLGLLAMLALVVVIAVLTPVMLTATTLRTTTVWQERDLRGRRYSGDTSGLSAPRRAVASHGQQGR